jgi:transcriptional regulator with XRE-family HTH domain
MLSHIDGVELIEILREFGYTQTSIANAVGVRQATISRIASGASKPSQAVMQGLIALAEEEGVRTRRLAEKLLEALKRWEVA